MTGTALVTLIVAVVVVLLLVGLGIGLMRRRLRPLAPEVRDRYAQSWASIETRFIEEPAAAVQEADQLVLSILRDRGARMEDERSLPQGLRRAREAARTEEGNSGTEGLRKAMLEYKGVVDDAIGVKTRTAPESRREVAS